MRHHNTHRIIHALIASAVVVGTAWTVAAAEDVVEPFDEQHTPLMLRPIAPEPHPFTIEPGRFQLEIEPLSYAYDRHNIDRADERTHAFALPFAAKFGLLEHTDVHIGLNAFVWEQTEQLPGGETDRSRGLGNLTLRVKQNIWGNDRGSSAFAVMPFIELPTHRHGLGSRAVQGGVMLPYALGLTEHFALDWTPTFAAVRDEADEDYVLEVGQVVTLNYEFVDQWTLFGEFESSITTETSETWIGSLGVGVTWDVDVNLAIEGVVHFGVSRAADDVSVALAIVRRW